jgi:uncharacterized phiE125 gp8 family phage protein
MKAAGWTLVTAATVEPLSLDEARAQLRLDGTEEDELVEEYVKAARAWCETYLGRALVTQTWNAHFAGWPADGVLELPLAPLQTVSSVKYTTDASVVVTVSASVYRVVSSREPGAVILAPNQAWPSETLDAGLPVVVQFVCGYGATAASVAPEVRQAMRWLVGHLFENREAVTMANVPPQVMPMSVRWALDPLRVRYIF